MIVMRIFSFFFLFDEFLRNLVIENYLLFLFVGIFFSLPKLPNVRWKLILSYPPPLPLPIHTKDIMKRKITPQTTACYCIIKANCSVLMFTGVKPWSNIMGILDEKEGGDTELLTYAMTLVNKVSTVKGIPTDLTS